MALTGARLPAAALRPRARHKPLVVFMFRMLLGLMHKTSRSSFAQDIEQIGSGSARRRESMCIQVKVLWFAYRCALAIQTCSCDDKVQKRINSKCAGDLKIGSSIRKVVIRACTVEPFDSLQWFRRNRFNSVLVIGFFMLIVILLFTPAARALARSF